MLAGTPGASGGGARIRIDLDAQVLWRDGRQVPLRPRTWAVLCHLVERPGALVTKHDLLDAVWGHVAVSEATLSQSISELRKALGDDSRQPRVIATVHRRGFRFLGGIGVVGRTASAPFGASAVQPRDGSGAGLLVGRDEALDRLHAAFADACGGARRLALISGEPGIGKTTLAAAFVGSLGGDVAVGLAGGAGELSSVEPFFPIVEAFRSLAGGPHGAVVAEVLRECAPSWLHELLGGAGPSAGAGDDSAPPARMLLRLARGIEQMARETPLVLVLEDLHWADQGTLDLLAVLARGSEAARLLIIATYRPSEAALRGDRLDQLRRELSRDARVVPLPLAPLSADDCGALLRGRFGGAAPPAGLVDLLYAQTEGNPLFFATAVDHLVARGWLRYADDRLSLRCALEAVDAGLPSDLVSLVEHETCRLSAEDRSVLEAGSVAGAAFSVQEVAAALGRDVEDVERRLEGLAASWRFVRCVGAEPWPDDSMASRWQFVHALHRRALLDRVPAARLQRWHQRIGERLEVGWAARREEVVTALAAHFDASRDRARALEYLDEAARMAERRCAPADARQFLSRALQHLLAHGGSPADRSRELLLRVRIVTAINAMEGYASPELRAHLHRAIELCGDPGYERFRFRLTFALVASCLGSNDARVKDHLRDLTSQAHALGVPGARLICQVLAGVLAILEGRLRDAAPLEQLVDAAERVDEDLYVGAHFSVFAPAWSALRQCALGNAAEARRLSDLALARSRHLSDRQNEAFALYSAAEVAAWDRDRDRLEALARRSDVLAREYGYRYWGGFVRFSLLRLQVIEDHRPGGFDALKEVVDEIGIDASPRRAILCCGLAEAALAEQRLAEGFAAVEAGLAAITSGFARSAHSELLRVRAALRRAAGEPVARVREDLEAALAVAAQQGAAAHAERVSAHLADLAGADADRKPSAQPRIARGRRIG